MENYVKTHILKILSNMATNVEGLHLPDVCLQLFFVAMHCHFAAVHCHKFQRNSVKIDHAKFKW